MKSLLMLASKGIFMQNITTPSLDTWILILSVIPKTRITEISFKMFLCLVKQEVEDVN